MGTTVSGGPNFTISGGTIRPNGSGSNLFHSFSQFNIGAGQSATFSGAAGTRNVLARVTGGSASQINGALRCDIAGANLFLMNRAGIVFGPGASLDVSGNLAATTADVLFLSDGGRFPGVISPNDSLITGADPARFGFLAANASGVGDITLTDTELAVPTGQTLTLVGDRVSLIRSQIDGTNGSIAIASAGSLAKFTLISADPASLATTEFARPGIAIQPSGSVIVSNHSTLSIRDNPTGRIVIRAGRLEIKRASRIDAIAEDSGGGAINVLANVIQLGPGGVISAGTQGQGDGGGISMIVDRLLNITGTSNQPAGIFAQAREGATGNAGIIHVGASQAQVRVGPSAAITASTAGGKGGNLIIRAGQLQVSGGSISASTAGDQSAGDIDILARTLSISQGGIIESRAQSSSGVGGIGAAGSIQIRATDLIDVASEGRLSVDNATGEQAGRIVLTTTNLVVRDGGSISSTSRRGNAGPILITATQNVQVSQAAITASSSDGDGGRLVVLDTQSIHLDGATLSAEGLDGGEVRLRAVKRIDILNGSRVAASAQRRGGNVDIDPLVVNIINSTISASNLLGEGGNVRIKGNFITRSPDSLIDATGDVAVTRVETNVSLSLGRIAAKPFDPSHLLWDVCAPQRSDQISTMVRRGRGGAATTHDPWTLSFDAPGD